MWSYNPSLFFGFFPFVLLEHLRKKRDIPLRKEVSEAYKRLKSTVDKYLSMSGYSEVNLGKLFTGSIGRSMGESSNERQWLIKNGGRLVPCLSVMISSAILYFSMYNDVLIILFLWRRKNGRWKQDVWFSWMWSIQGVFIFLFFIEKPGLLKYGVVDFCNIFCCVFRPMREKGVGELLL